MKQFVATVLLIPICSLPVGAAYSTGAPDGTIVIAAISAPTATALPKTPARAVATDIESRPQTAAAATPRAAARHEAISRHNATPGKAVTPTRKVLDLRAPGLRSTPSTESLLTSDEADSDAPRAVAVVTAALPSDERSDTNLSLTGVGSLYWAARHPTRAWGILLPMQPGDEFSAFEDIRAKCAVFPSARGGRAACP